MIPTGYLVWTQSAYPPALPDSVSRRNTWWSADDTPLIRCGYARGMAPVLPATRRRQHVHDDSQRWERFTPRPDDIFITTPPKSGTTWMQGIVASLLWPHGDAPAPAFDLSPWLDARIVPLDDMIARVDAIPHRRFIKTHSPADCTPISPSAATSPSIETGATRSSHLQTTGASFGPKS